MRGRTMAPPGVPSGYNLNQYSQQQGNHRGTHQNKQKRNWTHPHNQYSYYPPENQYFMNDAMNNSMISNYSRGGYGRGGGGHNLNFAGLGRGSGLIHQGGSNEVDPSVANLISGPRQGKRLTRIAPSHVETAGCSVTYKKTGGGDRVTNYNHNRLQQGRNLHEREGELEQSRVKQEHHGDALQITMYCCPKCGNQYSSKNAHSRFSGKVPLILQCSHTVCQECIFQGLKNNKVNCPVCSKDSVITEEQTPVSIADMQTIFLPNFYILGVVSYYKFSSGTLKNLDNLSFITTPTKPKAAVLPNLADRCCFGACSKESTMYCPSCEGLYCKDCCTVMHKSTNKLMSHEPVPKRMQKQKFSLMLESCDTHPDMQVEFYCTECDVSGCCYCVLDGHAAHERAPLYHLNAEELKDFKTLKKEAEKALKEVLYTQQKSRKLTNFDTSSVKKDVCQFFGDFHGKLEALEKKLCDELEGFKLNNKGLDNIQNSLQQAAEQLTMLVSLNEDKLDEKKFNFKLALEKLRQIDSIPRFLLNNEEQSEPIRFIKQSDVLDDLENLLGLEKSLESDYRLVTKKELPENYVNDLDYSDNEVEENFNAILRTSQEEVATVKNVSPTVSSIKSKISQKSKKDPFKKKLDLERVAVQHINSMDSFFVQYKHDMSKLVQLNKEIENFVKMGGAESVSDPQINELYLALYINESNGLKEQQWCRARLIDLKEATHNVTYEVFFIDYGKTQIVDKNRIREMPPHLAQRKPFIIECTLYNPMSVNWNKNAHFALAKILNGKDVFMMEKSYNDGIFEVDLMIASSDGGVASVTDILVHGHNLVKPQNNDFASLDGPISKKNIFCEFNNLRVFPNSKKFTKNQKEKVVIATVVDPYNLFVHLVQYREAFKAMNHAIKKAYRNSRLACAPIEGTYVLVEYKDPIRSNYHRGFIKTIDMTSNKVHVLLVDWGLNVVVPSNSIRTLDVDFTKLESQAVVVKMTHIAPFDKEASWSSAANDFLLSYFKSQDVLKMVVHETEPEVEVALFETSRNVDVCLNAMMVEYNLADSTGPISTNLEWPQYKLTHEEYNEEDGLMSSLLKKVNEEPDESDEEDLSNIKKRQIDVVKVENPYLIWVRFHEFRDRENEMFKNLQIFYSDDKERETKNLWKVDELCVARTETEYARGKILEINDDQYKIYLVDKVQETTVSKDRIYVYNKFFTKYPQALTKSHLANIKPAGDTGNWSISSTEALQEIFKKHKRIYACKAADADPEQAKKSLPLDIWYGIVKFGGALDPDRIKFVSVNKALVKLGYAFNIPKKQDALVKKAQNGEDLLKSLLGDSDKPADSLKQEVVAEIHAEPMDPETTKAENPKIAPIAKSKGAIPKKANKRRKHRKSVSSDGSEKEKEKNGKKKVDPTDVIEVVSDRAGEEEETDWIAIIEKELAEGGDTLSKEIGNEENPEDSPYHKREVAIDDWLPPFRLSNGEFRARVTCVETGGHLYLHEEILDNVYYKMEKNIKEYFDNNPPSVTDHKWEPGQLCTIKFTDGNWYRGRILKVINPEKISVFMIDFGSDHDLPRDVLFREVLYTDIGAFATRVKLDKVYPKSGAWLTSDYDIFHDLITDWCKVIVKGPLDVEMPLVEVYNDQGVFINQKLVEICPNLSRCCSFPNVERGEEQDFVIEDVTEISSADESLLVESFIEQLNIHEQLSIQGSANLTFKPRPLPKEILDGKPLLMDVGGVMHIDRITLCLPGSDQSEDVYNLSSDIQDVVSRLPTLTEFKVGMPCLAPFSEDNDWYRARITGIKTADLGYVDVLFVDYGNSEAVPTKNLKAILPQHMELNQLCWEASLNIVLTEGADIISVMQVINALDRKKKYVKLVSADPLIVDLYEKNDQLCYESLITCATIKRKVPE
ncbi:uncharacterized protein LOC126734498 isoform X2 [Anthonomus grandis grandis]|uniref:uncharacterized protein LOC126734498 isoform X2 n=1 Tax=Anthonomus grandis grandis TaxID=2921223 RepID=UPI00216501A5|nr:uncharacterized protein LOC126734498 isoform X2 [Anthonomus grandis grandis]